MPDAPVLYTVTATLPDASVRERYIAWLAGGHMQAVIAGGATSATLAELGTPDGTIRVQSQYVFPSRGHYDRYAESVAPALRAEGVRLFGEVSGVSFERSLGTILAAIQAS